MVDVVVGSVVAVHDPSTLTTDVTSVGSLDTMPMTAPMLQVAHQDVVVVVVVGAMVADHLDTRGNYDRLISGKA